MPSLGFTELLVTFFLLLVTITFWPSKTRAFIRRGWDPGFLGIKVWPARVHFFFKGHNVVEQAYHEAKDSPYMLQTLIEDVLVLPPRYLPELRMLPGRTLSASDALVASVLGQYSGVDVILKDRQAYDVTRAQLTKTLPTLLPILSQKAADVLSEALSACTVSDYTEINIQNVVSKLVLRTTLSAFIGPELADNSELHELVDMHPNLVRDIAVCLLFIPSFMRGWICPLLPASIRMRRLHQRTREILFERHEATDSSHSFKTLFQHLVETSDDVHEAEIVSKILVVSGAALHTMTISTVHAIIDLCAYPAHMSELRFEIAQHLPSPTPPWPADAIARLTTLDAFLKESQRFNPPNYLSFDRLAMTPITLSDGTNIPSGTYICMAAGSMAADPSFYHSPKEFFPQRFHPAPGEARGNLDFVGTESGNVHWGSGRFTCPGRWYASAMMKVFISLMMEKYDIKFPNGQVERLPNVYMDVLVEPDPKQAVWIRRR